MYLIKNGLVKTMEGPDIHGADVLFADGKIQQIGKNISAADAKVIDATDCIVSPGFVEAHCHTGLREDGLKVEGEDNNEVNDPVCPQNRVIDACNPMDYAFYEAMQYGVTSAVVTTGSLNVVGGQAAAIKTVGKRIDDMIIKAPVAIKIAFGENVKGVYGAKGKSPITRQATAAILRETLFRATAYDKAKKEGKNPPFDFKLEALLPVINREIPLKAHAHRADDIFTVIRIANEFNVNITLEHCTEGHLVLEQLQQEGKPIILGPVLTPRSKVELKNATYRQAKLFHDAGLKFAIMTDAPVIPLKFLSMSAGYAVKGGLPEEIAWRAITIHAAEIAGIANRVGSLAVGKDADIVVFKGNPIMDMAWETKQVFIDGVCVFEGE